MKMKKWMTGPLGSLRLAGVAVVLFGLLLLPINAAEAAPSIPAFTVETFATGITGAREVTIDSAGNVYTMGVSTGTVYEITPAGVKSVLVDLVGGFARYVGPYFEPVSGDLFVADCHVGSILRINISAGTSSTFVSGSGPLCRGGFTSDASGNLYVSDWVSAPGGRVVKVTPGGAVSTYATGLDAPDGIDFGPSGEMYVGNRGTNQIMRVPPGGDASGPVTVFASGMNLPLDVLSDSAGNVFAANYGNGTISKISPAGAVSTLGTGFSQPTGLAFDPGGNLFISDHGTGVIYKVLAVDAPASAELVANGDFETGDLTGWTVAGFCGSNPSTFTRTSINDGTVIPNGPSTSQPPITGSFDALQEGNCGPGLTTLRQTITVPGTVTATTLSWKDRIENHSSGRGGGHFDDHQGFRVNILNASGTLIQTVFSTVAGDPFSNRAQQPLRGRNRAAADARGTGRHPELRDSGLSFLRDHVD